MKNETMNGNTKSTLEFLTLPDYLMRDLPIPSVNDYMVRDLPVTRIDDYVDYRDHLPEIIKENDDVKKEAVNHPEHYSPGTYEVINIIEHYDLGFSLGNAVKYILRAGVKDKNKYIEDLEKAIWYINREIIKNA